MLQLILIRHSITEGNQKKRYIGTTDEPLCEEGRKLLEGRIFPTVESLYVSPMKRCIQTASFIYPNQKYKIVELLKECDFGEFENKNYLELDGNLHYQQWIDSNGTLPFPGGESREAFQKRSVQGLMEVLQDAFAKKLTSVAVIVHGGTIMSIMEAYGIPKGDYYSWHVGNGEGFVVELDPSEWMKGKQELRVKKKL